MDDTMTNWHDEPWAKYIAALGRGDRAALISAALFILAQPVCSSLESELNVLIECAQSEDLDRCVHDPVRRIDMQFAQCTRLGGEMQNALVEYTEKQASLGVDIAKLIEASAGKHIM